MAWVGWPWTLASPPDVRSSVLFLPLSRDQRGPTSRPLDFYLLCAQVLGPLGSVLTKAAGLIQGLVWIPGGLFPLVLVDVGV